MSNPQTLDEARQRARELADALNRLRGEVSEQGDVEAVVDAIWHCGEVGRALDDVGGGVAGNGDRE